MVYIYTGICALYLLQKNKILSLSIPKWLADNELNVARKMISVGDWVETIEGKGENVVGFFFR